MEGWYIENNLLHCPFCRGADNLYVERKFPAFIRCRKCDKNVVGAGNLEGKIELYIEGLGGNGKDIVSSIERQLCSTYESGVFTAKP